MSSIRHFLITSILAVIVLALFTSSIHGYQKSMHTADTLFDMKLTDQGALLLSLTDPTVVSDSSAEQAHTRFAFQIWDNQSQRLAASLHADLPVILDFKATKSYVNFDAKRWRSLLFFSPHQQKWIWIAEQQDARFMLAESIILESIIPALIVIPLIGLIILLIVNRGLKPVDELSREIGRRRANELAPITLAEIPNELTHLSASVNSLFTRLASSFEQEKRVTSNAAHELRTPLAALDLQIKNLLSESPTSNSLIALDKTCQRLCHLVEQILTLNRMTPDTFFHSVKRLQVAPILREQIAEHYAEMEMKSQSIELQAESLAIQSDTFSLQTLFNNLLQNAIKYTPQKGKIRIKLYSKQNKVLLEIHDNGPGIAQEKMSLILQPFYRLTTKPEAEKVTGSGLGLAIVNQIVKLHNASLEFIQSDFINGLGVRIIFSTVNSEYKR